MQVRTSNKPNVAKVIYLRNLHKTKLHLSFAMQSDREKFLKFAKRLLLKNPDQVSLFATAAMVNLDYFYFRTQVFGVSLERALIANSRKSFDIMYDLPAVVLDLIEFIMIGGLTAPDLFIRRADPAKVRALAAQVDHGVSASPADVYEACDLLVFYFAQLPEPLVPSSMYSAALKALDSPQPSIALQKLVQQMEPHARELLKLLCKFLFEVSVKSNAPEKQKQPVKTQCSAGGFAIGSCTAALLSHFASSILRIRTLFGSSAKNVLVEKVVTTLINECHTVFGFSKALMKFKIVNPSVRKISLTRSDCSRSHSAILSSDFNDDIDVPPNEDDSDVLDDERILHHRDSFFSAVTTQLQGVSAASPPLEKVSEHEDEQ